MALPKFIITMDGYLHLGMVNQHKDLLKPGDSCLGGGYYVFDFVSNRIIFRLYHQPHSARQGILRLWPSQVASAGNAEGSFYLSWHANRLFV